MEINHEDILFTELVVIASECFKAKILIYLLSLPSTYTTMGSFLVLLLYVYTAVLPSMCTGYADFHVLTDAIVNGTNLHKKALQQTRPLFHERCEVYKGSACRHHMNSQRLVFMRAGEDQHEIEKRLVRNIKRIGKLTSPECYPEALRVACISLFPPCRKVNGTAVPLLMCKESCAQLSESYCSKGIRLLPQLKIIQAIDDCSVFPETDSNQPCARVSMPGFLRKSHQCKRQFRLKAQSNSVSENHLSEVQDSSSICKATSWVSMNKGGRLLLRTILRSEKIPKKGQIGMTANNWYCFQVPVRISRLFKSSLEYSNIIPLPELPEIPYNKFVGGFSVNLDEKAQIKRLTFPVGIFNEYSIDKRVTVQNVTVYAYKDSHTAVFFGRGVFDLCGTKFQVKIEQTKSDETLLTGQSPHPIDLSTVELAFGFRQPTEDISHVMKSFKILKLRLINPKLRIHWKDREQRTMRLSGHAYNSAWGSEKVNVELLLGRDRSFWATALTTTKQSFREVFGLFTDWNHNRLTKLLDTALDVDQVRFVLATKDVETPSHPTLNFQHVTGRKLSRGPITQGITLDVMANVKGSCKRNNNRPFICEFVQFAAGAKASANVKIKSHLSGFLLSIEFHPDGITPQYSSKVISKLRETWEKIDPFSRVPSDYVEIIENDDNSWKFLPRYSGIVWIRKVQVKVNFTDSVLFDSKIVYISADVIHLNKRYTYKINKVGLRYCLRMLDSITEFLKMCGSRT